MIMTPEELFELTGYKSAKFQIAWLRLRHWVFELDRLDRPKVDLDYYKSKMGVQSKTVEPAEVEPNWAAMH